MTSRTNKEALVEQEARILWEIDEQFRLSSPWSTPTRFEDHRELYMKVARDKLRTQSSLEGDR